MDRLIERWDLNPQQAGSQPTALPLCYSHNGRCGIRTHGTLTRTQHFQCCSFNHSDNLPTKRVVGLAPMLNHNSNPSQHHTLKHAKAGNGIRTREESLENFHVATTSYPQ